MLTGSALVGVNRITRALAPLVLWAAVWTHGTAAPPAVGTPEAVAAAVAVLAGAEDRFQAPSHARFAEAQEALRREVDRVNLAFEAGSAGDAAYWKSHLRWELLERNLGAPVSLNLDELKLVRRWMYSNREGLESPFFAPLRAAMDSYLDAASTELQRDLPAAFRDHVSLARSQCEALAIDASDARAAHLAHTLDWFERMGQLTAEVAAIRALVFTSNAQLLLDGELVERIMATQVGTLTESIPLREQAPIPPANRLQRARTMNIQGSATITGDIRIEPTPNERLAEFVLIYEGAVESTARGRTGPVSLNITADGYARTAKPMLLSTSGLTAGETVVTPRVSSRLAGVSADNRLVELIARRRATQPESKTLMDAKARETTIKQLTARFDQRVEEGLASLRADFARVRASMSEFGDVTAPLVREGVVMAVDGMRTTTAHAELNASCRARSQPSAAAPCPVQSIAGDIVVRVHASFFNNMAETITGGKTLSDEFIMKYAKVLHAELPLPLMVHSRAPRWALTMATWRPLEVQIPNANQVVFIVRIDGVQRNGETTSAATTARIAYRLLRDEFGDYRLDRQGEVQIDSELPEELRDFVGEKLSAFFGPVLNGGGVVVPEGGSLGVLRRMLSRGVHAEHGWIVAGWDVPTEVVTDFIRAGETAQDAPTPVALQESPTARDY